MRPRLLLPVLAIAAGLWAPRDAAAFCQAPGPYFGTGPELPLGCPVHVYQGLGTGSPARTMITVLRGAEYVDVTGVVDMTVQELELERTFVDCQLRVTHMSSTREPFGLFAIHPAGAQIGERIGLGSGWLGGIEIVAAGACAAPIVPELACTAMDPCGRPPPFPSISEGGCGAGGGGGLAIGLALIGLARRRRRA